MNRRKFFQAGTLSLGTLIKLKASAHSNQALNNVLGSYKEWTLRQMQQAMNQGKLTALELLEHYLQKIEAVDKKGLLINSILHIGPLGRDLAKQMDRERKSGKLRGPLHGIPVLVKDNTDTADMPTTAGSLALKTAIPKKTMHSSYKN